MVAVQYIIDLNVINQPKTSRRFYFVFCECKTRTHTLNIYGFFFFWADDTVKNVKKKKKNTIRNLLAIYISVHTLAYTRTSLRTPCSVRAKDITALMQICRPPLCITPASASHVFSAPFSRDLRIIIFSPLRAAKN